ncbi:MAG: enhanced serine sensitivity protein SseB [Clostridia bacterium]|nr:enhanced serine sensitivity protein SseB [Clostridia bacterium]
MSELKNVKMEGSKVPAEKITNPELCAAIEKMQSEGSKENIDAMINEVVKAKFILPAKVESIPKAETKNGRTIMGSTTQVQFRLLENGNKEKFFGAFTDISELNKWNGNEQANKVVTDFDSLAQMVTDPKAGVLGFVINPFGKSVTFPKPMVLSIKQQRDYLRMKSHKTIEPGSPVQLGDPKEYPIDLMAALINHFSTEPLVNAAYLRMVEQNGLKSYLIVVDFVGDTEHTFDAISDVAKPFLDDEVQLSMMPYSMEFGRTAVKGIEPFYKKKSE